MPQEWVIGVGNAGPVPQVLQQINYKEKKRMEWHSKLKET